MSTRSKQEDEFDLFELIRIVRDRKIFIGKIIGFFFVLGILIALTNPKEFYTSATLIAESSSEGKIGGSLGGLASLAGVNLGTISSQEGINPGLYRSIAQSRPFMLRLMKSEFYFSKLEQSITLYDYTINHQERPLADILISIPKKLIYFIKGASDTKELNVGLSSGILRLTKFENYVASDLSERILVTMDWELNTIKIEVTMQDPLVAAEVTKFTMDYITKYVIDYSISKSQSQLNFVESQYVKKKVEFEKAQRELAEFKDRNLNINTVRAKSEGEQAQSKYNLAFDLYRELAQQRETIKLQLNSEKPVFTVLEPVSVPVGNSEPRIFLIIVGFIFVGLFFGVCGIFLRELLQHIDWGGNSYEKGNEITEE